MQPESDVAAANEAWLAVQANPRNHAAWNFLAVAAVRAGSSEAAVNYAERAHSLDRRNADYLMTLGIALTEAGRIDDGIGALQRAVKLRPGNAEARSNLGNALRKARRYEEAHEEYALACAMEPRRTDLQSRLAVNLLLQGRSDEALPILRRIQQTAPQDADTLVDIANALSDIHGVEAAIDFLEEQLSRLAGEPRLRFRLAQSLLAVGCWQAGWREYLWRPEARREAGMPTPEPLPADLSGKHVLLLPDQGLGDMLFFLRFATDLRARGARILFGCPQKLLPLMRRQAGIDEALEEAPSYPCLQLALGDLPYAVQAAETRPVFPIQPKQELVAAWRAKLSSFGPPPYIGLTWRAGTDPRLNAEFGGNASEALFKEVPLDAFASALRGVSGTLVSLQRLPSNGETDRLSASTGCRIHDASASNEDLEEMAALLAALGQYVAVSNTNVHLRAGLGLASKVLVPHPAEFRWMATGPNSPWFPECTIYRQSSERSWNEALQALCRDLGGS
jgi:Flp pilus assembly protein TadD